MTLNRVTLSQRLKGQLIQNVFHLINAEGSRPLDQVADEVQAAWIGVIKALQGTQLTYTQIMIEDRNIPGSAPFLRNVSIAGTATGFDPMMPFLAIVIQKRTAVGGRAGRGRYYVAGFSHEGLQSDGQWQVGHQTGLFQNVITNLTGPWIAGTVPGLRLCVAPKNATSESAAKLVNHIEVRPFPGLQRRRSVGVGA